MSIESSTPATLKLRSKSRHAVLNAPESNLNPNVSQLSKFLDDVWDFAADMQIPSIHNLEKRISWGFKVKGEECFTAPKYAELLLSTRQLLRSLLQNTEEGPAQKPMSILHHWTCIKKLLTYL